MTRRGGDDRPRGGGNQPAGGGGRKRRRRRGGKGRSGGSPDSKLSGEAKGGRPSSQRPGGKPSPKKAPKPQDDWKDEPVPHVLKRYGICIYDSFPAAKADLETLRQKAEEVDQLNIVIRAEGDMDDPELLALQGVKVFAGAAWTTIHERRKEEGWYEEPR